jgi:type III restriction enzyme
MAERMKLKFDGNLGYQQEAITAITEIFEGQELCKETFTVLKPIENNQQLTIQDHDQTIGYGNRLKITQEAMLDNVKRIQLKNGIKQSKQLDMKNLNFTIEMETGTGKTYVYLRTIFELNKLYGFTKFIIVVPSIAIKEGANKFLEITSEHFKEKYDNVMYDYFTYDSGKLNDVRSFAVNDYIQIMVINIQAFRKSFTDPSKETKANIIHRDMDKLGDKPINLIAQTSPIVIIDEPQSVDTTLKSKEAIRSLNPLCCLRYSATHKEIYDLMYKLDSVDAFERKLVKQIIVSELEAEGYHNTPYIKLIDVSNRNNQFRAKVEIDINQKGTTKRVRKIVKKNDDLEEITKREIYEGYIIDEISCYEDNEFISFTSKQERIRKGQTAGLIDEDIVKRQQISSTIEEHLNNELLLNPRGIKVLSLFFIDRVANYRQYDEDGNALKGKYARIFEEGYKRLIVNPKYNTIFKEIKDLEVEVEEVHNGYFSIDNKGKIKDTKGDTKDDDSTYNLIMKDKEKLLSFDSKLRFIFSHSTLKEGWDNPNVFQICTLNETSSEMRKRQEIGRGLRLAVNQDGERVHDININKLTVMANESYADYVSKLQKELESDLGIRFGYVDEHTFANIVGDIVDGEPVYLGEEKSKEIVNFFLVKGYIEPNGKVSDKLKEDLLADNVELPDEYMKLQSVIQKQLRKIAGDLNIKKKENKKQIKLNKEVFLSPEFKELWDKIKYKTTYSVEFDNEKLIEKCVKEIQKNLSVSKGRFIYKKASADITRGGVIATELDNKVLSIDEDAPYLPDIISYLQNETHMTRRSIVRILIESRRLDEFKKNPQKYIDQVIKIINTTMVEFIIDGIKYRKIGESDIYAQELFKNKELFGFLKQDMVESSKSPYAYVRYDSSIEEKIVKELEKCENVIVYAKLPNWFKIDTPLGTYNPDWAILWEKEGNQKLYFIVESKGSDELLQLRGIESGKIQCGKKHFESLETGVVMEMAKSIDVLRDKI